MTSALLKFDFFHRKAGANDPANLVHSVFKKMKLEKFPSSKALYHIGKDCLFDNIICKFLLGDKSNKLYFILEGNLIQYKLKSEQEIQKDTKILSDKHILTNENFKQPKIMNVLRMLHTGKNIYKEHKSVHKQDQTRSHNSILGKLKDLKGLAQKENGIDLSHFIQSFGLNQKYFVNEVCTIKYDGKVSEGAILGENDVLLYETYLSLVISVNDVYALSITKENLHKIFDNLNITTERKSFFVKVMPTVHEDIINKLCMSVEEKAYRINEIIYNQGDSADSIFFIKDGDVQVTY